MHYIVTSDKPVLYDVVRNSSVFPFPASWDRCQLPSPTSKEAVRDLMEKSQWSTTVNNHIITVDRLAQAHATMYLVTGEVRSKKQIFYIRTNGVLCRGNAFYSDDLATITGQIQRSGFPHIFKIRFPHVFNTNEKTLILSLEKK